MKLRHNVVDVTFLLRHNDMCTVLVAVEYFLCDLN